MCFIVFCQWCIRQKGVKNHRSGKLYPYSPSWFGELTGKVVLVCPPRFSPMSEIQERTN